jgi:predicted ferric reductase
VANTNESTTKEQEPPEDGSGTLRTAATHSGPFRPYQAHWFASTAWGALLCAVYPVLVLTPLAVFALISPKANHALLVEVGVDCAVVAFSILALQFVLAARVRWLEAPFGLDILFRFHRLMALVALALLCLHPLLLASGESWGPLTRWRVPGSIWVGRLALLVLIAHIVGAIFWRALRLRYETWRWFHTGTAFLLLGLGFFHSLARGKDFENQVARAVWTALPLLAWTAWFYGRQVRPWLLARSCYQVVSVVPEAPRVWTLTFDSPGKAPLVHAPGQFLFLQPKGKSVLAEEHPFSIASSPTPTGRISVTIKESGDFTTTIGRIEPGEPATLDGPFGRFSHIFHSEGGDLVFVAAGVGITPLMSMLRYMCDRHDARRVLLVYANRTAADIVFRKELESIEARGYPALKTIHVLSQPPLDWVGRSGRVDTTYLKSLCGDFSGKTFYICCPPTMASALIRGLQNAGVSSRRIHADQFGL